MRLNIAPHLARAAMTQTDLADRVGVKKGFMSEIISGKKSPSFETLLAIADALKLSVGDLFTGAPASTSVAAIADAPGMAEDATPFSHGISGNADPIRALYADRARNAAITHRASIPMPGFGIAEGDLIVCDLSRQPNAGEVAIAVSIDTDTGTAHSLVRRYAPPYLLSGDHLATQAVDLDQAGIEVRHPVVGIIRGA